MSIGSDKGLTRSEIRKRARIYSGYNGTKQGKKTIESVTIDNPKYNPKKPISSSNKPTINVAPNYEVNGVKAKNLKEGVTVNKSKYGEARGRLGGGVGRIPIDKRPSIDLEEVGSESTLFTPNKKNPKETIAIKGYDVNAKSSSGLAEKVDEGLTKTVIGKDITQPDKEFTDAPEWQRNKIKKANRPKYTKGSRDVLQVIENADVKANNATTKTKEGTRKRYREYKKDLKMKNLK